MDLDNQKYFIPYGSTAIRLFTGSDQLREKTHGYYEIELGENGWRASVYRVSSRKPGSFSREISEWTGTEWVWREKDTQKYQEPPDPSGSCRTQIGTFQVITKNPISEAVREELSTILRLFPIQNED